MELKWQLILLEVIIHLFFYVNSDGVKHCNQKWIVHVPYGEILAKEIAKKYDLDYVGPVLYQDRQYYFQKRDLSSNEQHENIIDLLRNEEHLTTVKQECVKVRAYRGTIDTSYYGRPQSVMRGKSSYVNAFNDKYWKSLWYFQDYRTSDNQSVRDMNIVPVYYELEITGAGVNIAVPDDGLQYWHPDILPAFNPDISFNFINNDKDIAPTKNSYGEWRSHGTRCVGEIAMQPNNDECGVGTAFGASVGGIKFLDDQPTDVRESNALKHRYDIVDIYSNSWGPSDNGYFMEHISDFAKESLSLGIHQGREGKGCIYVFAAGNGKPDGDNCAADGYVNSLYTIVIASADDGGRVTHYSERCPAITATAYSGSGLTQNVVTTDVGGGCTLKHTGTSAAAPLVSGIIALALSANPSLTYRDVKHLLAWTSQIAPLENNYGWIRNAAGFYYSLDFGFGLVNAYQLVKQAKNWVNVPKMASCALRIPTVRNLVVERSKAARIRVNSEGCSGLPGEINYLEEVQLVLSMVYPKRGDIQISMKSPQGTEIHILEPRPKDTNPTGLRRWSINILALWGESPKGNFTIDVFDQTGKKSNKGKILEMNLVMYGTKEAPQVYSKGYRPYDAFTLLKRDNKSRFPDV
ncbi:neuroendocrine convertase 1-like [Adelges cooleyi]|uniref:neuroendocrine convertase 1-like n=1 Tax=Adelges cooleyi TaxID=133065 RepID=UPI00217F7160|nr:neuroendocrine convertase 1-like [Adelges cooleyi]